MLSKKLNLYISIKSSGFCGSPVVSIVEIVPQVTAFFFLKAFTEPITKPNNAQNNFHSSELMLNFFYFRFVAT